MGSIVESSTWEAAIYLLETSDPVEGGVSGKSNRQAGELANRSKKIYDILKEVGIYIDTGDKLNEGQGYFLAPSFEGTVSDADLVYRHTGNNQFEKALADGTAKAIVIGFADVTGAKIVSHGLIDTGLSGNPGDLVYLSDTNPGQITMTPSAVVVGKFIYDGIIFIDPIGVGTSTGAGEGDVGFEADMYHDLLQRSYYEHSTFNACKEPASSDPLLDNATNMTFDATNDRFDFTTGQILQSTNLYDSEAGLSEITEAMVFFDYVDGATPTVEMTADGVNWETVANSVIHQFTDTGLDLRVRFTGGGTGQIDSFCILYKPFAGSIGISPSVRKLVSFYYEGSAQDETVIIDAFYFDHPVVVDRMTINARVAPVGSDILVDILKDDVEQTRLSTLTAGTSAEKTILSGLVYFEATDKFGLRFKNIGSTEAGQGFNITVHYFDR